MAFCRESTEWVAAPARRSGLTQVQSPFEDPPTGGQNKRVKAGQYTEADMSTEQPIELEGTVSTVLPGTMFRVRLDNQHEILAHLSGKMRKHFVRLTVGDRVRLEMSPYDLSKARITYRLR
jgi:translation initiation factor IF-1